MNEKRVWFITGADRGIGAEIAKAALAAAIGLAEQKVADLKAQIDAYYDLSTSLDLEAASLRA